jgi:hypothetical protein
MPGGGVGAFAFAGGVEPAGASGLLSDLHEFKSGKRVKSRRRDRRFIKCIYEA